MLWVLLVERARVLCVLRVPGCWKVCSIWLARVLPGQLLYLSIKDHFMRQLACKELLKVGLLAMPAAGVGETLPCCRIQRRSHVLTLHRRLHCFAGLRDLILRNTNITNDELPQDIWTAVGAGGACTNPAGSSSGGAGSQQRLATAVLNGQGNLEVILLSGSVY